MKKIITINVIRFNQDAELSASFIVSEDTQFETVKSAVFNHVKYIKDGIVNASDMVFEDGETDGLDGMRQETYNEIIRSIAATTSISDFHRFGRFELDDGEDEDTNEKIMSHVTIWSIDAEEL